MSKSLLSVEQMLEVETLTRYSADATETTNYLMLGPLFNV